MFYRIVENEDKKEFLVDVHKLLKDGWIPQGGVSLDSKCSHYIQAMLLKG